MGYWSWFVDYADPPAFAYAQLDRDLAEHAAPAAAVATGTVTHFLSARMGCQVLHPVYGLDLAALCVQDAVDAE